MEYTEIERIKARLREQLTEKRYAHTMGTLLMAMELSVHTPADRDVVFYAALLHDCAKYRTPTAAQKALLTDFLPYDKILHAPLGALIAREEYGIDDERILNAIRYHATGRPGMSIEEKIVFLADAIEDGRAYPCVEEIRKATERSLEEGMEMSLRGVLRFEGQNGTRIHPLTQQTLDDIERSLAHEQKN
ncbi:MAG: bis(5'-nucleosyl)-tetraphosphatase (symmetrical) YqeK [Clostridia bacterium]|nr:bis(5'-nucleosyl)-tetraphosphatase (symmetrical) YqeK [Clostridia bacterium]